MYVGYDPDEPNGDDIFHTHGLAVSSSEYPVLDY
jgi:hypothetical protein